MPRSYCIAFGAVVLTCCLSNRLEAQGKAVPLPKKINAAIDKGVTYLKEFAITSETARPRPATWSLRGWALLEAGVPGTDESVKKMADYVRKQVPEWSWDVYDLSLGIIFFDRLGDAGDEPLLESLAVRLLAGQLSGGGWGYQAPKLSEPERARLTKLVEDIKKLRQLGVVLKSKARTPPQILEEVDRQTKALWDQGRATDEAAADNSNTQFAMMAMWVARRHGMPVDIALAKVQKRFRASQLADGRWAYKGEEMRANTYPAMTCAGLLGIALGEGVKLAPQDLSKDPQVQRGFDVLAKTLASNDPTTAMNYTYFLFSMERVAVVYRVEKIGGHDWYQWGVKKLLAAQSETGYWPDDFSPDANTAMALLFLKRANVARDLAEILEAPIRKGPGNKKPAPK